jgi:ferrochelatase
VPSDYTALLLLGFGGPEHPDHVRPFLENVTRGRGVPPQRLDEVAQHYLRFGGISPINAQNRQLITEIEAELGRIDRPLPVYFGNRNWHPMIEDTVATIAADGHRRVLVFATSAWGGFSGCRQYDEDIARARARYLERTGTSAPELTKLPQFHDHPLFLAAFADAARAALATVPDGSRLVFTAHSIPEVADAAAGPPGVTGLYSAQVRGASAAVAARIGVAEFDVVWQSRSGPPTTAWLAPDINDHLAAVAADGAPGVAVVPIGFVSDHLEVIWDLDTEGAQTAAELGLPYARAATCGRDPRFAAMVVDLVERARAGAPLGLGFSVDGDPCVAGCCPAARPVRRA